MIDPSLKDLIKAKMQSPESQYLAMSEVRDLFDQGAFSGKYSEAKSYFHAVAEVTKEIHMTLEWMAHAMDALQDKLETDETDSFCSYLLDALQVHYGHIFDICQRKKGLDLTIKHISQDPLNARWIYICRPRRTLERQEQAFLKKIRITANTDQMRDRLKKEEDYLDTILTSWDDASYCWEQNSNLGQYVLTNPAEYSSGYVGSKEYTFLTHAIEIAHVIPE